MFPVIIFHVVKFYYYGFRVSSPHTGNVLSLL